MYSQNHIQDKNCYKIRICYVVNHCKMELHIIITSFALLAFFSAKDTADAIVIEDSLVPVGEGTISRNLPENFTAISWQEIADSYLCSSGRAQDIVEALKTFEPDSTWFVLVG